MSSSRSRKPTWTSSCHPSLKHSRMSPWRQTRAWRSQCRRANPTDPSRSRPWVPALSQRVSGVFCFVFGTIDDFCWLQASVWMNPNSLTAEIDSSTTAIHNSTIHRATGRRWMTEVIIPGIYHLIIHVHSGEGQNILEMHTFTQILLICCCMKKPWPSGNVCPAPIHLNPFNRSLPLQHFMEIVRSNQVWWGGVTSNTFRTDKDQWISVYLHQLWSVAL